MKRLAIVGFGGAGYNAAKAARSVSPDAEIDVYTDTDVGPYNPMLTTYYVKNAIAYDTLFPFGALEEIAQSLRLNIHTGCPVTGLLAQERAVELANGTRRRYDSILLSTGASALMPPIPGIDSPHVLLCKNWDHAIAIKEKAKTAKSAVVIGSGYIGAEIAEQFSVTGVKTTLVDGLDRPLANNFDKTITDQVAAAFEEHGVTLALGQKVVEFRDNDDDTVTVVTEKGEYTAEMAILAVGFLPNTDLLKGKVDMLPNGAIVVDDYMQASAPGVYAAGDSATVFYNPTGQHDYIPLATNAVRQGLLVGRNIETPTVKYMGTQATSAVQLYDLSLAASGLTRAGAERRGLTVRETSLTEDYRPDFMLTTTPVTSILTWDPETRKVKGGQFCSKADISGAANVISMAIQAGFTIDQLANVDFLFQPNFDKPVYYVGAVAMKAAAE